MRQRFFGVVSILVLAALALGCQGPRGSHDHGNHARHAGFADAPTSIEMVSTKVGGKNVFIPSTVVLTPGEGRTLSLFNTTEMPHGFKIPALGIEEVLPSQEEYVVELPALKPGVYAIGCHLHPPHRGGTLVVLGGGRRHHKR